MKHTVSRAGPQQNWKEFQKSRDTKGSREVPQTVRQDSQIFRNLLLNVTLCSWLGLQLSHLI